MTEFLKRHYLKEEEFLDEFYDVAAVATKLLDGAWEPNADCDDTDRKEAKYLLSTGELYVLVFKSAAVYHDGNKFSSAQILLESSNRIVNIKVKSIDGELVAEKMVDKTKK